MRLPTTLQAGKKYYSWVKLQPLAGVAKTLRAMSTSSTKNKSRGHWGTQIPMHSSPALGYIHSACQSSDDSSRSSGTSKIKFPGSSNAAIVNAKTEKVKLRPAAKVSGVSEMLAGALNIVAREVGVEMEDLETKYSLLAFGWIFWWLWQYLVTFVRSLSKTPSRSFAVSLLSRWISTWRKFQTRLICQSWAWTHWCLWQSSRSWARRLAIFSNLLCSWTTLRTLLCVKLWNQVLILLIRSWRRPRVYRMGL